MLCQSMVMIVAALKDTSRNEANFWKIEAGFLSGEGVWRSEEMDGEDCQEEAPPVEQS